MDKINSDSYDSNQLSVEACDKKMYNSSKVRRIQICSCNIQNKNEIQIQKKQNPRSYNRTIKEKQLSIQSNINPISILLDQNIHNKKKQLSINSNINSMNISFNGKQISMDPHRNLKIQQSLIKEVSQRKPNKIEKIILPYQQIQQMLCDQISQKQYQIQRSNKESRKNKISLQLDKMDKKSIVDPSKLITQKIIPIKIKSNSKNEQITVDVYFPYEPYTVQINYMQKLIQALQNGQNALLQSPTGTGKTLCLLSAVLSWIQFDYQRMRTYSKNKQQPTRKKIIFLSRTHSQLKQCIHQLKKTCFKPTITTISSRQQSCIKKQFDQIQGKQKNNQCSKAVKMKIALNIPQKLAKLTYQQKKQYKLNQCIYYSYQTSNLERLVRFHQNKIIDNDQLKILGQKQDFCPYYYSKHIKNVVDICFMPYNYILSANLLKNQKQFIENRIVVFDQAHNVSEVSSIGRSYDLTSKLIQKAIGQLQKIFSSQKVTQQLLNFRTLFKQYSKYIQQLQNFNARIKNYFQMTHSQRKDNQEKIDNMMTKVIPVSNLNLTIHKIFIGGNYLFSDEDRQYYNDSDNTQQKEKKIVKQITSKFNPMIKNMKHMMQQLSKIVEVQYNAIQQYVNFIQKTLDLVTPMSPNSEWGDVQVNHYRLFIKLDPKDYKNFKLQLNCLSPSITFKQILSYKPRSIIMTSGTLSPLSSWSQQLQIPFQHQIQNPHVIKQHQLELKIVQRGKKGTFNFSYNNIKDDPLIYLDLVESVIELLRRIPNGVLVIFPSYRILKQFEKILYEKKLFKILSQFKYIFSQQKNTGQEFFNEFKRKAQTKNGAVLFLVCRGKMSQGIDFSDDLCRGVIFVGVPYANIKDPWIIQKKLYLDDLCRKYNTKKQKKVFNSHQWYDIGTIRAVNQSLGRVIRHINDYGMIFLLDERFNQNKLKKLLPLWAKNNLQSTKNFERVCKDAEDFFRKI